MRGVLSGRVTIRPARLGLIVQPTLEGVREAVRQSSRHWGGLLWPILPYADDDDRCYQLGESLSVDALVPLGQPGEAAGEGVPDGFRWGNARFGPFEDDPIIDVRPMTLESFLRNQDSPHFTRVTWSEDHPLADVFLLKHGPPLGDEPLWGNDYPSELPPAIQLGDRDAWPTGVVHPYAIELTALDLQLPGRGREQGIVLVDPANAHDLAAYWNLRASGQSVLPWSTQFTDLLVPSIEDNLRRSIERRTDKSKPVRLTVWRRGDAEAPDLQGLLDQYGIEVLSRHLNGPYGSTALDPAPSAETEYTQRFDLDLVEEATSARVPLPRLPFLERTRWRQREGFVVADVRVSSEYHLAKGYRASIPAVRWLAPTLTVMPIASEPMVRPIPDGVAKAIGASAEYTSLWFTHAERVVGHILEKAALEPSPGPGRQLMARLIDMLGGLPGDASNQPSVRAVLETSSRSPYGKPVTALAETVKKYSQGWENSMSAAGDDYSVQILSRLTHAGLLAPVLRFDCMACGSTNALPSDLIRESLRCQLCREEVPLGTYLSMRRKLNWHLAFPSHLTIDKLRETFPVMAAVGAIQGPENPLEYPILVLSTLLEVGGVKCEVDFVGLFNFGGLPTLLVGEAKANAGEVSEDDVIHLRAVQSAIRATGLDCVLVIAKMSPSLTDAEVALLRGMCEEFIYPIGQRQGEPSVPICPLVLLGQDLSVDVYHQDHPWSGMKAVRTVGALAEASCRRHLGLTGWDWSDKRPEWSDSSQPETSN